MKTLSFFELVCTNRWKIFYVILFFAGLISMFFEITLYRKTIISWTVLFLIASFVSVFTSILNRKHYQKIAGTKSWFFLFAQNLSSWGFLFCYLFMAMNFYFRDTATTTDIFTIQQKSSLPGTASKGQRQPTVYINYYGIQKELIFSYQDKEVVNKANAVKLQINKGALGFDVIQKSELTDGF